VENIRPDMPLWARQAAGIKCRAWVAHIASIRGRIIERRFLRPNVDFSRSNSVGSRGVYFYFWLEERKIYEVSAPISWRNTDRYFCRVENGQRIRMEKDEAEQWLKDH